VQNLHLLSQCQPLRYPNGLALNYYEGSDRSHQADPPLSLPASEARDLGAGICLCGQCSANGKHFGFRARGGACCCAIFGEGALGLVSPYGQDAIPPRYATLVRPPAAIGSGLTRVMRVHVMSGRRSRLASHNTQTPAQDYRGTPYFRGWTCTPYFRGRNGAFSGGGILFLSPVGGSLI
jgi:hypothetical protein